MNYIYKIKSPVGTLTLSSDGVNLTGLWLEGQKYFAATLKGGAQEKALPIFLKAEKWLGKYFDGKNPPIDFPLAPMGSEFRKEVWNILSAIPYGTLLTYGDIAKKMGGKKMSAQAVGGAVGHNPISIIIPCHRVVGSTGSMTGYAGGLEVKAMLLKLERAFSENLFVPKK